MQEREKYNLDSLDPLIFFLCFFCILGLFFFCGGGGILSL